MQEKLVANKNSNLQQIQKTKTNKTLPEKETKEEDRQTRKKEVDGTIGIPCVDVASRQMAGCICST